MDTTAKEPGVPGEGSVRPTAEQLARWKAECIQAAQEIEDKDFTDFNADPAEVLSLIDEVERLRDTVKQRDATAAEQSAAIERLREKLRVAEVRMREADEELEHVADALERYQPLTDSLETAVHKLVNALHAADAEVERLREKCDDLTVNGFQAKLKQLDEAKKEVERLQAEVKRLKEVVAGYCGSGQRIQDLSDDCGLLEESNKALRAEVERPRGERAWQSIETAPRDREVLVAFRATGYVATAIFKSQEGAWLYFNDYHDDGELRSCDDCDLSGWMPLPKPPAVSRGTGEGGA